MIRLKVCSSMDEVNALFETEVYLVLVNIETFVDLGRLRFRVFYKDSTTTP